jgi:hypothetical protein
MDTEVERRVRAAFAALADTVDVTEPPARRKRWYIPVLAATAAVVVIAVGVLAVPSSPPPVAPVTQVPPPPPTPPAVPYDLYTHCGVDEARIGETYYEAETPFGDGSSPPGWGDPYQHGTMTALSPTEAVFHDTAGHEVRFRVRPGATTFKKLCD